jgi:hypothetical protein
MTTQPNRFDSNHESQKSEESISRSRYHTTHKNSKQNLQQKPLATTIPPYYFAFRDRN